MSSSLEKLGNGLFMFAVYLFFILFSLICIFPFYYIFINTISDNTMVNAGQILFLPKGIHFNNYIEILKLHALPMATLVSVARTVLGTGLSVVVTAFLGYAMSKRELWGRKFWYRFTIVTMYFNAGIIPWYLNMRTLGLLNNFLAYIIPSAVSVYNMILIKTYVESLPASVEESAEIDGAGYLKIFSALIFPMSTPILATIAIFTAVGQWNNFSDTLFLVTDAKLFTLQFLLYKYLNQANNLAETIKQATASGVTIQPQHMLSPTSVRMTITILVSIPVIMIYPFFQRYFVKGIMIGAVKG